MFNFFFLFIKTIFLIFLKDCFYNFTFFYKFNGYEHLINKNFENNQYFLIYIILIVFNFIKLFIKNNSIKYIKYMIYCSNNFLT